MAGRGEALRASLTGPDLVVAPGVFDLISARMADSLGFDALYMTGYGVAASLLGMPDAGYATYSDMVGRVAQVAERTSTPLIADADTGFGGALNVAQAVRGYERAGAVAIQIEDQEFPKKCGHTLGRKVVPLEDMVTKIRVAADARESEDFLIVARTDARTNHGPDEALRRGEAFAAAGADVLFIESPESEAEMAEIGRRFDVPVLANMVPDGRTPVLSRERLVELGFAIAIYPSSGFAVAAKALRDSYAHLRDTGSTLDTPVAFYPFEEMNKLMGFEEVWAFDAKYGEAD